MAARQAEEPEVAILAECREGIARLREERNFLLVDLAEARETNARLNRRCQVYEAGIAEKLKLAKLHSPSSFGRLLACAGAEMYRVEAERLRARVAELEGGAS